eukprot:11174115-Lingulodinium_polyedra.AAC.1
MQKQYELEKITCTSARAMHVHMRAAARERQVQDQYRREDAGEVVPAPRWRPQRSAHGRSL